MIKPLTSLRFIFAFLVFMSHNNLFPNAVDSFLWHIFREGYAGVSFFFMLSGFILAYTYQQRLLERSVTIHSFYIARIARIYPLHLSTLFISLFFIKFFSSVSAGSIFNLGLNAFLLQSFVPGKEFLFNAVSWSLSDEAFFYAMFPIIVFSIPKIGKKRATLLLVTGLLIIMATAYLLRNSPSEHWVLYINPLFRIFDLSLGIAIYNICHKIESAHFHIDYNHTQVEILALCLIIITYCLAFFIPESFRRSVWYWIPMGILIATFYFQKGAISRFLSHPIFVKLGEISFAFYLFHYMIIRAVRIILCHLHLALPLWQEFCITLILSITTAYIAHRYIEQPANKFIRKRFSR